MSKIKFQGNASGTGVLTITSPNTDSDRTITLPDEDVTLGGGVDGIVSSANATAITIDSNENVLIGKTTYVGGSGVTGIDIRPAGMVNIAREGDTLMYMNRKNSDGDIVEFRKDGTSKGSIGVNSSGAYITLGGTGAANTLDDYETGTWTPAWNSGSNGRSIANSGSYTKIGNRVYVSGQFNINGDNNTGSGDVSFSGLPFTSHSEGNYRAAVSSMWASLATSANISGWVQDGSQLFYFRENGTTGDGNDLGNHIDQDTYFWFSATYQVA